jgi:hypothetical protein
MKGKRDPQVGRDWRDLEREREREKVRKREWGEKKEWERVRKRKPSHNPTG